MTPLRAASYYFAVPASLPVPRASSPLSPSPLGEHPGWRSRGYLPHFDSSEAVQHVVFRLKDALPARLLATVEGASAAKRLALLDSALDRGHGERLLANPGAAEIAESALIHFDGVRYRLFAWCIMPTHVHVLIEQAEGHPVARIVHTWKSFSANAINRALGRAGALWAPEYYDRFMRNEAQFEQTRSYIEANPVTAGLCARPEEWRFSSAFKGTR